MTDAKNNGANPSETKRDPSRNATKHGIKSMKASLNKLGSRVIDKRTRFGRALYMWREQLIADLGGDSTVTVAQLQIIETAVRTKLILDSVDAYLADLGSGIINKRNRKLYPVVQQRTALADSLLRQLTALGLERKAARVPSLQAYIEGKAT